jgi:hypothetical protein
MDVNFDGYLFPVYELLDKTLVARVNVNIYNNRPELGGTVIGNVAAGNPIGTIYSYVGGQLGAPLYWQFISPAGLVYYVEHRNNRFNVQLLEQQGVLNLQQIQEQQQEQENEFFPGLNLPEFDLGNVALLAGVLIGGFILYKVVK